MPETSPTSPLALSVLTPPYQTLAPFDGWREADEDAVAPPGAALVWQLSPGRWGRAYRTVRSRPGGVALLMILPPADRLESVPALLEAAEQCRPHSVLPYHARPDPEELCAVLRRAPEDLPLEVMDYLSWRGLQTDLDTRRLFRKVVELSADLQTVSGLARSLYMSRRALGRRFRSRGLPVPSHVLHFSRILRGAVELQTSSRTLFEVACGLGYPDGFSLSNQMLRLTGIRPSTVRNHLGWEWIVEAWLRTEAKEGKIEWLASRSPRRSRNRTLEARVADPGAKGATWRSSNPDRSRSTP